MALLRAVRISTWRFALEKGAAEESQLEALAPAAEDDDGLAQGQSCMLRKVSGSPLNPVSSVLMLSPRSDRMVFC